MPLRLCHSDDGKVLRIGWHRVMPDGRKLWAEKWDTYGRPLWTGQSEADRRRAHDLENVSAFAAELYAQVEIQAPLVARGRQMEAGRARTAKGKANKRTARAREVQACLDALQRDHPELIGRVGRLYAAYEAEYGRPKARTLQRMKADGLIRITPSE